MKKEIKGRNNETELAFVRNHASDKHSDSGHYFCYCAGGRRLNAKRRPPSGIFGFAWAG